jgi:hypothetical protein
MARKPGVSGNSFWGARMTAPGGIEHKRVTTANDHAVRSGTAKPEAPIRNAKDKDVSTYGRMLDHKRKNK